ncbi:MAG: hypothetical protein JWP04_4050, partial [Belnapia sp.]|nr:hypothetical protein [Belnapia sp.]
MPGSNSPVMVGAAAGLAAAFLPGVIHHPHQQGYRLARPPHRVTQRQASGQGSAAM